MRQSNDMQPSVVLHVDEMLRRRVEEGIVVLVPEGFDPAGGGWVALVCGIDDGADVGVWLD